MAGIYIHIPFCKQACHYCNFHFSTSPALQNDFTVALLKEMELSEGLPGRRNQLKPSILAEEPLHSCLIRQSVQSWNLFTARFPIHPDPEITLEANPDDMDPARLDAWKETGINRLSIGVQSFFDGRSGLDEPGP